MRGAKWGLVIAVGVLGAFLYLRGLEERIEVKQLPPAPPAQQVPAPSTTAPPVAPTLPPPGPPAPPPEPLVAPPTPGLEPGKIPPPLVLPPKTKELWDTALSRCIQQTTPEGILSSKDLGPELITVLAEYFTCRAGAEKDDGICQRLPTGLRFSQRQTDTLPGRCFGAYARMRLSEGLVANRKRAEMLPWAKIMVGIEKVSPDEFLDLVLMVYREGRIPTEGLKNETLAQGVKDGYFNFLIGKEACGKVTRKDLEVVCLREASALEAVKLNSPERCPSELPACRGRLQGEAGCQEFRRSLVKTYCLGYLSRFPPTLASKPAERRRKGGK